jgi:hypothetical protein
LSDQQVMQEITKYCPFHSVCRGQPPDELVREATRRGLFSPARLRAGTACLTEGDYGGIPECDFDSPY